MTMADEYDIKMPDFSVNEEESKQEQSQDDSFPVVIDEATKDMNPLSLTEIQEEESNQSFNEQEMLDQDGHFIIFAPESKENTIE